MNALTEAPTPTKEQEAAALEFGGYTTEQCKAKIASLAGSREFVGKLSCREHPGHNLARETWSYLHSRVYPGQISND